MKSPACKQRIYINSFTLSNLNKQLLSLNNVCTSSYKNAYSKYILTINKGYTTYMS